MKQATRLQMNQVSAINPVPDARAAGLVSRDTFADLAEQIMATSQDEAAGAGRPRTGRARAGRVGTRRRLLVGIPVTAAIVAAALAATVLVRPGQKVGPITVGPASAQALSFARDGRYIDITVRNPVADASVYRAEFAAHHLHVTLRMVPASPSLVGTLVYMDASENAAQITTITAKGRCWTGGGGNQCPVGVRIPIGFRGRADFTFGRAARPGEQYETTGSVTAPGEAMHGLHYQGQTVAAVLTMLHGRHVTVPQYRADPGRFCHPLPRRVPSSWIVYDADPWAAGQILLWVAPASARGQHCAGGSAPGVRAPAPKPSASPTGG
jgi:hypothetical protein